jgi:hypothetical protein
MLAYEIFMMCRLPTVITNFLWINFNGLRKKTRNKIVMQLIDDVRQRMIMLWWTAIMKSRMVDARRMAYGLFSIHFINIPLICKFTSTSFFLLFSISSFSCVALMFYLWRESVKFESQEWVDEKKRRSEEIKIKKYRK